MPSQKTTAGSKKRKNVEDMVDLSATESETETEDEYEQTETETEDDGLESGDEEVIDKSNDAAPVETRSVYYFWGSSKPIDGGTDKYEVTREGKEFDAVPDDKTPLPGKMAEWSELRAIEANEFVSAYRVRDSSSPNIVRYYIRNGQPQWLEQAKKMLPDKLTSPLTHGILANLSLHLHGIVCPTLKPDKELLKHDDLKNFRLGDGKVVHIYDTQYAKKYLHRQKKNAERSAAKKAAAKKTASPKATVPEVSVADAAPASGLPPFPVSPKKAKAKAGEAAKQETAPAKKPAKSPSKLKPRQLKLGGSPLAVKVKSAADKPEAAEHAEHDFALETSVELFRPLLLPMEEIMRMMQVRAVPKAFAKKRKLGAAAADASPSKRSAK